MDINKNKPQGKVYSKEKTFLASHVNLYYDVAIKCEIQTNHGRYIRATKTEILSILPACMEFHLILQQV